MLYLNHPVTDIEKTAISILFQLFAEIKKDSTVNQISTYSECDKSIHQLDGLLFFLIDCGYFQEPVYNHVIDIQKHIYEIKRFHVEKDYQSKYLFLLSSVHNEKIKTWR